MRFERGVQFGLLFALGMPSGTTAPALALSRGGLGQRPEVAALESRLFELTNGERQKAGLPPLRLLPELEAAARRHSSDMAGRNVLSHDSSDGRTLADRLAAAGIYYSGAGENIARSATKAVELINRSWMDSPEHRKNILNAAYDAIGIGAVLSGNNALFVTEDFIASLEVLDTEQSVSAVDRLVQEIRRQHSAPPLVWDKKVGALAREMARARAEGRQPPAIPASFGEMHVLSLMTPRLGDLREDAAEIGQPAYREGGFGVAFTRTREDPGGAYFIVLALLPRTRHLELTDRQRIDLVMDTLNARRLSKGLRPLVWRNALARDADALRGVYISTRRQRARVVESGPRRLVFFYETVDLGQIPAELEAWIVDPVLVGVGLMIVFEKTRNFPRGAYRVTVVVE